MKQGNRKLAALADTAVDVIRALVTDPDAPPAVRLRAAKLILDFTPDRDEDDDGDDNNTKTMPSGRGPVAPPPPKIGRNDYCPCGSGLKFKKCCLGKADRSGRPVVTPLARPAPLAREGPPAAAA